MVYLGRICGVGLTEEGKPAMVYAVSGRSEASRQRKATIVRDPPPPETSCFVHIGPLESDDNDPLRHYDAIICYRWGFGVVSNGRQTGDLGAEGNKSMSSKSNEYIINGMAHVLQKWGAEPDEYKTPRIGGAVKEIREIWERRTPQGFHFCLGRVSEYGLNIIQPNVKRGNIFGISTYNGDFEDPRKVVVSRDPNILILPSGRSATELANNLYDWMDQDFVVCTAAAVYDGKKIHFADETWRMVKRNLHK